MSGVPGPQDPPVASMRERPPIATPRNIQLGRFKRGPTAQEILSDPRSYGRTEGILGALDDYVLRPMSNLGTGIIQQGFIEPGVGVANLFGAGIKPPDLKTELRVLGRKIGGDDKPRSELLREEMAKQIAYEQQPKNFGAGLIQGAAQIAGDVTGTFNPLTASGRAFSGLARVGEKLTRKVLGSQSPKLLNKLAPLLGRAEGYGALEGLRTGWDYELGQPADGWERAEAMAFGALTWPAFEIAGALGRYGAAKILSRGQDKAMAKVLGAHAQKAGLAPRPNEPMEAFIARALDDWVAAGMPGAPKMGAHKLMAAALEGGIEGIGFSALDVQWWKDGADAVLRGDDDALARFIERTAENALGIAALKVGGRISRIAPWQRQQPTADWAETPPRQALPAPEAPKRRPDVEEAEFKVTKDEPVAKPQEPKQPALKEPAESPAQQREPAVVPGRLVRLGWSPREGRVEIEGTPYGYELTGDVAKPSEALRRAMGWPEGPLPREAVEKAVERLSLVNALKSKADIAGEEVSVEGVRAQGDRLLFVTPGGQVMARPIGPEGKWTAVDDVARREPDQIDPPQGQIVKQLQQVRAMRPDLPPSAEVLLDAMIDTLSKVSETKDPAVGEALAAWRQGALVQGLLADPASAEAAIVEMAHSLTTKSPMVAMADLQTAAAAAQAEAAQEARQKPEDVTQAEYLGEMPKGSIERARAVKTHKAAVRRAVEAGEPVRPEVMADYPDVQPTAKAYSGFVPHQVVGVLKGAIGAAVDVAARVYEADTKPLIERVRSAGYPELADKGWQAVTRFKVNRGRVANQLADYQKSLRTNWKAARALSERLRIGDAGFTRFHLWMDEGAAKGAMAAGVPEQSYSKAELDILKAAHDLFLEAGRFMEEAGARIGGGKGDFFTVSPTRYRMVRRFRPAMIEALQLQSGKLYDKFVEQMSALNGMDIEMARTKVNALAERGIERQDATEFLREFEVMPDAVWLGTSWTEVLEANPYAQVTSMVLGAAQRSAYIESFGQRKPEEWLETVKGTRARKLGIDMMRSLAGLPLQEPFGILEPGSRMYEAYHVAQGLLSLWRGLKMTKSFIVNIPEIWGAPATYLGADTVGKTLVDVIGHWWNDTFQKTVEDLAERGIITRDVIDWRVAGSSKAETFRKTAELTGRLAIEPMHLVQELTELRVALGIRRRSDEMQAGRGRIQDYQLLRGLGFNDAKAKAMMAGEGSAEDYQRYEVNAPNFLVGGTTGTKAEKSWLSQARGWRNVFLFSDFFRAQMHQLRGVKNAFADWAKEPTKAKGAAALGLGARWFGWHVAAGTVAATLAQLFSDGEEGPVQWVNESLEDPEEFFWTTAVGSFFGGAGGAILEAVREANEGSKSTADAVAETVPMVTAFTETFEFARALLPDPPSSSQYAGMGALEKVAAFAGRVSPLVRDVERGLFGVTALAMTEDPEIGGAMESYWRWRRKNDPTGKGEPEDATDREFRTKMKVVGRLLRAGKSQSDPEVRDAVREAAGVKDWKAVAASLRARKTVAGVDKDKRADMEQFVGDKHFDVLRAYDRSLDILAGWAAR